MMRLIALESFCIGGGVDVKEGQEFDAEDHHAKEWLWQGRVRRVEVAKPAPEPDKVRVLETKSVTNRDPKIGPSKETK